MQNSKQLEMSNGFTLIELIVVIILISILAVTVLPKFFDSNGFEEYTYRDEVITKLRAIQLRTMQQTDTSQCQVINVDTTNGIIGLLATNTEINTPLCKSTYAGDTTKVAIEANHSVSFSASENITSFSFSALGRPLDCPSVSPCEITLTLVGQSSLAILINTEGYIYAL